MKEGGRSLFPMRDAMERLAAVFMVLMSGSSSELKESVTPAVGRGGPRDEAVRDVVSRRSVWYAGSGGLSQVSPDHGADVFWVIRQDVPECDTPEPGVELGTACDEGEDDPLVRAIDVEVVPRDLLKDVRVDANIER